MATYYSGTYVPKKIRQRLMSIGLCMYCGQKCDVNIDHIHPKMKGGKSTVENLTTACNRCNSMKCAFSIPEFLKRIKEKRDFIFNKFFTYTGYLRRIKKGRGAPYDYEWLTQKVKFIRSEHSYFTNIIKSITFGTYKLTLQWDGL